MALKNKTNTKQKQNKKVSRRKLRPRKVRGRGDYDITGPFEGYGRLAGKTIGGYLGGLGGRAVGSIFGSGDYTLKQNTIIQGNVPTFGNSGRKIVVQNREYIGDLISSATAGDFKIQRYDLNPGNPALFPWMSTMAQNYQEYHIKGMIVEFVSKSGDALNSVNTALGSVIMTTQYNPLDPPYINKQQMENSFMPASGKPSENIIHGIECAPMETTLAILNVRKAGQSIVGSDKRFYDMGVLSIASVGCQGVSVNLGEIWVSYDIELLKPVLSTQVARTDFWNLVTVPTSGGATWFGPVGNPTATPSITSYSASKPWVSLYLTRGLRFDQSYSGTVLIEYTIQLDARLTYSTDSPAPIFSEGASLVRQAQKIYAGNQDSTISWSYEVKLESGGLVDFGVMPNYTGAGGILHAGMYIVTTNLQ